MDARTRELLLQMPEVMLHAWEQRQFQGKSLLHRHDHLKLVESKLVGLTLLVAFFATFLIAMYVGKNPDASQTILVGGVLVGIYFCLRWREDGRRKLQQPFEQLQKQLCAVGLATTECCEDLDQIIRSVNHRLRWDAHQILLFQRILARQREDAAYTEDELEETLAERREYINSMHEKLEAAKVFGLNVWDRKQCFDEAKKQILRT